MHCILILILARIIVVRFLNQHNIDTRMMNKDNQYCYDKRNLHFYGNFHLSHLSHSLPKMQPYRTEDRRLQIKYEKI